MFGIWPIFPGLRMVDVQYNLNEQPNEGGLFFWFFNSIFLGNGLTIDY